MRRPTWREYVDQATERKDWEADQWLQKAKEVEKQEHGPGWQDPAPAYTTDYLMQREWRRQTFNASEFEIDNLTDPATVYPLEGIGWTEINSGANYVRLSCEQIDILRLRYYGLSIRDISDTLDIPTMTVHRYLCKAIVRLHTIPAFGLWSVLAETFRVEVGTVKRWLGR